MGWHHVTPVQSVDEVYCQTHMLPIHCHDSLHYAGAKQQPCLACNYAVYLDNLHDGQLPVAGPQETHAQSHLHDPLWFVLTTKG
jgi:hypothetical protein